MTKIKVTALIVPMNNRSVQRSMTSGLRLLDQLNNEGLICSLERKTKYVSVFLVHQELLRNVERRLQTRDIPYQKEACHEG